MDLAGPGSIEDALSRLGSLLAAEGESFAIVIIGGAALNLLKVVTRATTDVDILAFAHLSNSAAAAPRLYEPPTPLPEPLARAARTVARDLGLDDHWLKRRPGTAMARRAPAGS